MAKTTKAGTRMFEGVWEHFKDHRQVEFEANQGKAPGFQEVASRFFHCFQRGEARSQTAESKRSLGGWEAAGQRPHFQSSRG